MENKILLVEDEENLSEIIALNLQLEGHKVDVCSNGKDALSLFCQNKYNLLILDVMLPEISGFEICEEIRKTDVSTPVLFLTAKSSGEDRVKGLKLGADDYLTKPFNLEELLLRVNILLKRASKEKEFTMFHFGDNFINFQTYQVKDKYGKIFSINKKELQLLKLLIERNNMVVSRNEILDEIWGDDVYPSSRTIDNYILAFRKYFEENTKKARYFHSIRGVGYKFTS